MLTVVSSCASATSFITSALHRQAFRRASCLALTLVSGFVLLALNGATRKAESRNAVTVHAAGRGNPYLKLEDGRQLTVAFRGESGQVNALQNDVATSRALVAADLDGDAAPDLVTGYANGGTGIVTVQRGNPEGFAPKDDSVFQRIQQGYNPPSLQPTVDTYQVSSPVDFLQLGDFNRDGRRDVLIGSRDGILRLLPGDGQGGLGAEQEIALPGSVTALTTGEFRAADGRLDIAVGINGPAGPEVLVFDGAAGGFESTPFQFPIAARAVSVEFGELDSDPFMDLAIADGTEISIVHGWGRKVAANAQLQVERIPLASAAQSIAVDNFTWDREGTREIAVLAQDGSVRLLEQSRSDKRPLTPADVRARAEARGKTPNRNAEVEVVRGWSSRSPGRWSEVNELPLNARATINAPAQELLTHGKISTGETNALMVVNQAQRRIELIHQVNDKEAAVSSVAAGELSTAALDMEGTPAAMIALPKKLNGVRDMVMLQENDPTPILVPILSTTFTVNTISDHAPDGACNASPDCTLREAVIAANTTAGADTIDLPAGTYTLTIIGNTNSSGAGEGFTGNASIGDLDFRDTNGDATTVMGAGSGTTFIVQSTANDRTLEPNPTALLNFDWTISGVTVAGGRDTGGSLTGGGGGALSGSKDNITTVTNCVWANNRATGAGTTGGGGISNQGGSVVITNTVFGGATTVAACPSQTATNCGNSSSASGGGIAFSPGDPQGRTPSDGTLTVQTTSSFQNNTAASATAGGGGLDLYTHNLGTGSVSISGTTFTTNAATGTASGGGIIVESIDTTVATTTFTNNSAGNRGGGIQVAGGSLLLDGTSPSITFTGNTATTAGSSISTSSAVNLSGTNTTIGGDLEITTNGVWTNNTGSTMSPNNLIIIGTGSFTANNSTTNVSGNFQFQSGTFNAGTGLFNFNGTGSQTINNSTAITFNNLTDSNVNNPLTINNNIAVNGTLNVDGANAILAPLAATIVSGPGTLTGTGTARVTRTAATADFLNQYTITNKTLTNLTIDYNGAGSQTVNNTPPYSNLIVSGSGTKTLQGNTSITGNLNIAAATFSSGNFNFSLGGNWTNAATFTPGTGTVTFAGSSGTQTLTGNTTFFNLTLNNAGATTNFGATTTTIGNDLVASAGTMDGGTSTIIFTGTGDNIGSYSGANAKDFNNLQINSPATISNLTGGNTTIKNDYTNNGTFTQAASLTTTFATGPDGNHSLFGAGTTTFGNVTINSSNTVDAGSHNFNVVGTVFTVTGTFTGNTSTVSFNGAGGQGIAGDGAKNFSGLLINNPVSVNVINGTGAVDASVSGLLTLTTDLMVASGAILQQSGTSAGAADVIGTVRRTDLGVTERAFGNPGNTITVGTGTPPTQMDFNLVKMAPGTFPATVKVVPRDITLTPTGGAGFSATVKLRYIDPTELTGAGITESRLILWKNVATVWTPQGGTDDAANNFVSLSGVTSFSEWAIAEGSDLTLSKANDVANAAVTGQTWNWTLTAANSGAPATFTTGQTILSDNLPNSNLNYGTPTVQNVSNITGSANISCSIVSNDLTCTANGGSVTFDSNLGVSNFDVVFSATAQAAGSYQNPRTGGGIAKIDPNNVLAESNEANNTPTNNTVTVSKANTTTSITSDNPDPSVVGQAVTVQWSVTVNAPGSLGAALTGNVTVSDGTDSCMAAVSAGQCDITFTSAGAKSITATYAGDTNYNGSASTPATAHTVNAADTTTTITSDNPDPSNAGQSVDVTYTVVANAPGGGTPTGNVQVSDGVDTNTCTVLAGTCALSLTTTGNRTITATYQGNSDFNMSSDTESHDVVSSTVSVNDAKKAEPTSGTTNMTFTVALSSPATGAASVDFTTADEAPGAGKAVAGTCGNPGADYVTTSGTVSFTAGQQVKTISVPVCSDTDNAEPDETFLVNLSNPSGLAISDGTATGTITVANPAAAVLISELRTRGTGGTGDDFVELYNNSNSPLTITASDASAGYGLFKMGTDCNDTPVLIATIPNSTVIPARGHYLIVGSTYSLADYGGTGAAAGNVTMSSDIDDDKNVAVFSTANVTNISSANRLDAVGFGTNTGSVCDLLREGTNQGAVGAMNIDYSFFRKLFSGNPQDTNDNSVDFLFADTQGTNVPGVGQRLGAPGPENLASPLRRDNTGILLPLLDATVSSSQAPNRFRNFANVIPTTAPNGTLEIRRRVENTTGAAVTRLRFRIVDITTFPSPGAGTADLRAITSVSTMISVNDANTCFASTGSASTPCTVTVLATTLETPPNQTIGGGYNSTLSAGTITLGTPLAAGASINVNFQLGVVQAGTFRVKIIIEALP